MTVSAKGASVKTPHRIHIKHRVAYDRVRTGETVMRCGFRYPVCRVIPADPEWVLCKQCERLEYDDSMSVNAYLQLHFEK